MHLVLFEDAAVAHLRPLVDTRAAGDLRVGVWTLFERQRGFFPDAPYALHTRRLVADVTAQAHPNVLVNPSLADIARSDAARDGSLSGDVLLLNQRVFDLSRELHALLIGAARPGEPARLFFQADALLAAWLPSPPADLLARDTLDLDTFADLPQELVVGATLIDRLWHLVDHLPARLADDLAFFPLGTHDGATVEAGALLVQPEAIHLAPGATVKAGAIVTAADGPVVLDAGAVVEEGAIVKGPCYVGPRAQLKMQARIDGSVIGPQCKVGGEVHASVFHSFSNKAHDGYLGNAYVGRWCNLGAGTTASNLKNDYGEVTLYDAVAQQGVPTGRQFLGLFLADHSKAGIQTMFNTGTVVGVSCNVFGGGFPPRHVPSFAWGGAAGFEPYRLDKALRVAEAVLARRGLALTDADRALLATLHEEAVDGRQ